MLSQARTDKVRTVNPVLIFCIGRLGLKLTLYLTDMEHLLQNQVIQKVIQLEHNSKQFTGFLISNKSVTAQYIATARHTIPDVRNNQEVYVGFRKDNEWKQIKCIAYTHNNEDLDIILLRLVDTQHIKPNYNVPLSSKGMLASQQAFFLGFPFGLNAASESINEGFPIPFIKVGIISAISSAYRKGYFYLDGHNNKGFSGGPVAFYDYNEKTFKICGVVSGFLNENLVDGAPNSGIVSACYIGYVQEILSQNNLTN